MPGTLLPLARTCMGAYLAKTSKPGPETPNRQIIDPSYQTYTVKLLGFLVPGHSQSPKSWHPMAL
jgi:hypothetical protein